NSPDRDFLLHCIKLFVAGFFLITISQTAGALGSMQSHENVFWFPLFANEFLDVKKNLHLMETIGGNGYGNTDNYISLWSLIIPLIAGLYYIRRSPWWIVLLATLFYCGLVVYSRAGLLVVTIGLVA